MVIYLDGQAIIAYIMCMVRVELIYTLLNLPSALETIVTQRVRPSHLTPIRRRQTGWSKPRQVEVGRHFPLGRQRRQLWEGDLRLLWGTSQVAPRGER